ncbi:MAG: hypothetical protein ACYTFW_05430 [Planctomycetota bacterium]
MYCGRNWGIAILIPFIVIFKTELTDFSSVFAQELVLYFIIIVGGILAWHAYRMAESDNENLLFGHNRKKSTEDIIYRKKRGS